MKKRLIFHIIFRLALINGSHSDKHPVREDIINEINLKANTWIPLDIKLNPMKDTSIDDM